MCTMTGIAIGQAAIQTLAIGVGFVGQMQAANAQAAYQNALAQQRAEEIRVNSENAAQSARQQYSQIGLRMQQEAAAATNETVAAAVAAEERRATVRTAAGESGVAGLSVDALLADFDRQEASFKEVQRQNLEWNGLQAAEEMKGVEARAKNQTNSISPYIPAPVERPSLLAAGLQIAGVGLTAIDNLNYAYGRYTPNRPEPVHYSPYSRG